jgi:hypothetical protein
MFDTQLLHAGGSIPLFFSVRYQINGTIVYFSPACGCGWTAFYRCGAKCKSSLSKVCTASRMKK